MILCSIGSLVFLIGCNTNDDANMLETAPLVFDGDLNSDTAKLEALFNEIVSMAGSEVCSDSKEWLSTPFGYRSCGGIAPAGYLAYSKKINVDAFLEKVAVYRVSQKRLNEKWQLVSTCELIQEPKGIRCEDGAAVLEY